MKTGNEYGVDANGEAILLSSQGQQVMMQWEKDYMEQCVDALCIQPYDSVLEIGFGLAYSASRIQHFRPKSHTIIECDATVLKEARHFAHNLDPQRVEIVKGTWQDRLPSLGLFDCVFFDDYPLPELENASSSTVFSSKRSRWHDFLDVVLHHVRPGARITGYLAREIDLQRPGCEVVLTKMRVDVSSNCNYYPHQDAFIPVISVVDPEVAIAASSRELLRERLLRVREQLTVQEIQSFADDADTTEDASVDGHKPSGSPLRSTRDAYVGHASRAEYLASLRSRSRLKTTS